MAEDSRSLGSPALVPEPDTSDWRSWYPEKAPPSRSASGQLFLGLMLIIVFALVPIYIFPSGRPQLADVFILILMLYGLAGNHGKEPFLMDKVFSLFPFIAWAVLINFAYFLMDPGDMPVIWKIAELSYSFLLLYSFTLIFKRVIRTSLAYIYLGIVLSIFLAFLIKGSYEETVRFALSFNNPNQLGYFSLLLLGFGVLLIQFQKTRKENIFYLIGDIIIIIGGHLFALLASSRGAIMGIVIMDIWLATHIRNKKVLFNVIFVAIVAVSVNIFLAPDFIEKRLYARPGKTYDMPEAADETQKRILHQFSIMSGVQYIIGRGGGSYSRDMDAFNMVKGIGEVHNIFGDIFRCYGLIGLTMFSYWIFKIIWTTRVLSGTIWIWTAVLLYNMSHNGVRFRAFWLLIALMLAMVAAIRDEQKDEAGRPSASQPGGLEPVDPTFVRQLNII
ncbi:MAG: hypothetical protein FJ134_02870 [Deltaproteobacteria bacterium]|nr:hypothetical protein [Deltaproteobacteria bacterium]